MFMKKALKCLAEILQSGFGAFHKDFSGKTQALNTTDKHLLHKVQGLLMVPLKYLTA